MHHNIKIGMQINFASKWHIGSGESGLLVDRLIQRDTRGWPFIPGSTLKGVVRESCEKLSRSLKLPRLAAMPADPHQTDLACHDTFYPLKKLESPVDRLFGNRYESSNLFFRDARLAVQPHFRIVRDQSRNSIYRILGTARESHLFSTDYVEPASFSTHIEGYHSDLICIDGEPPFAYLLLVAGILSVERLGADKSTGCGKIDININSIEYNGQHVDTTSVFEYLDAEWYMMMKKEMA